MPSNQTVWRYTLVCLYYVPVLRAIETHVRNKSGIRKKDKKNHCCSLRYVTLFLVMDGQEFGTYPVGSTNLGTWRLQPNTILAGVH